MNRIWLLVSALVLVSASFALSLETVIFVWIEDAHEAVRTTIPTSEKAGDLGGIEKEKVVEGCLNEQVMIVE